MVAIVRTEIRRGAVLAVLAASALLAGTGCGSGTSGTSTSPAASSTATSAAVDVNSLIIDATDIPIAGFAKGQSQPIQQGPANGVRVQFASADQSRQLGDTVVLLPDVVTAKGAVQGAFAAAPAQLGGAAGVPVQVGETAMIFTGTVSGQAVTVLAFQQGRALVTIDFVSAPSDPVPPDVVTTVGQKQAEKIKAGVK